MNREQRRNTTELTGQQQKRGQIAPQIQVLKDQMDKRIDFWSRMSLEKKRDWIKTGKDPMIALAWNLYTYLRDHFFGDIDDA